MSKRRAQNIKFSFIPIVVGGVSAALCLIVRVFSGSPYEVIHIIDRNDLLPPVWLLNVLSILSCFLSGFSAGLVIDEALCKRVGGRREIAAYRGGLFFLASFFLVLVWHPVFFSPSLFAALIITVLAFLLSLCALLQWSEIRAAAAFFMGLNTLWCFYMFVVNLAVLLCN